MIRERRIKLTDRLQAIADFVKPGESIADIGTDHGFLPMTLFNSGVSPHVILCDVNKGPLEKASNNIIEYFPGKTFDMRLGDGLSPLEAGEVDVVVIAGMGGLLIADILAKDIKKTRSFKKFILQPRNAQDKLRSWLYENSFDIIDEVLVKERKYICEIIVAVPQGSHHEILETPDESPLEFEISPLLFQKKDPLLLEFLKNKIKIEEKIIHDIKKGSGKNHMEQLNISKERLKALEGLLASIDF
ncbi:MAG: tRNA (adenine(22)-N(1))-methyltransferase [Anaerovoracaceae bacterium]|jgi:tRNA (adenine22-N1)-methyltransferase